MSIPSLPLRRRRRSGDGLFAPQYRLTYGMRRRKQPQFNIARQRITEMQKLIEHRHGVVPDTDDADLYVFPVAAHLRQFCLDLHSSLSRWCQRWAPHMPKEQVEEIADRAVRKSYKFKADTLGEMLRLTDEERSGLKIRTIGAFDRPKAQRAKDRKKAKLKRDRERALRKRRERGARPRSQSLSRTRPWNQSGISRRTWERRRKRTKTSEPRYTPEAEAAMAIAAEDWSEFPK